MSIISDGVRVGINWQTLVSIASLLVSMCAVTFAVTQARKTQNLDFLQGQAELLKDVSRLRRSAEVLQNKFIRCIADAEDVQKKMKRVDLQGRISEVREGMKENLNTLANTQKSIDEIYNDLDMILKNESAFGTNKNRLKMVRVAALIAIQKERCEYLSDRVDVMRNELIELVKHPENN